MTLIWYKLESWHKNEYMRGSYSLGPAPSEGDWFFSAAKPAELVQPPYTPPPHPVRAMREVQNFVAVLARAA
jgi:hypothetical protein